MSEQDGTDSEALSEDATDSPTESTLAGEEGEESPAEDRTDGNSHDASASEDSSQTADLDDIAEEPEGETEEVLAEIATDVDPPEELVEQVSEADPETVATELAALRDVAADLEADLQEREREVDDLESRLKRKQADFQNYKKRQKERLEEEKERATEDLVTRLLDVRDSLRRALEQDDDADIRSGVESTLRQFDEQLRRENVEPIDPAPGDETDPRRHEVLMGVESDLPEGTIVDLHRPGYEMAGKVLREAQVTVSEGVEDD